MDRAQDKTGVGESQGDCVKADFTGTSGINRLLMNAYKYDFIDQSKIL